RLRAQERDEGKLRAGRVAAGIGDQPCGLDLGPVDFRKAVNRLLLQVRGVVLVAVPTRIRSGVAEAKIGGEIDYLGGRSLGEQVLDDGLRGRVRQRAEGKVERSLVPVDAIDCHELRQRIG